MSTMKVVVSPMHVAPCRLTLPRAQALVAPTPLAQKRRSGVSSRGRRSCAARATFAETADLEEASFGQHSFKGAVAQKYLAKHGESSKLLDTPAWTANKSDVVAAALLDWARDNGASVYCHWFQPMGSSGFRFGQSGQVYNTMLEFDNVGSPQWKVRRGRVRRGP